MSHVRKSRRLSCAYLCFLKTLKVWSLGKLSLLSVSAWKETLPIGDDDDSDVTYKQHDSVW